MKLASVTFRGYKSIANLEDFKLRHLNVLIGANGAGKSNFISVFRLLAALADGNLQGFVQKQGGPDTLIHRGRKRTRQIDLEVYFRPGDQGTSNGYRVSLTPTADNRLVFSREETWIDGHHAQRPIPLGVGHEEAKLKKDQHAVSTYVRPAMQSWRQYHFHDTGETASIKQMHPINDNLRLKPDASNLAAYLRRLKTSRQFESSYERIVDTIRRVAPFFGDFVFRDDQGQSIELEWTERGNPDTPWKAHVLSDGTLRFICLTTLLLQPSVLLPDTILIDEPELGLHPFAINILADMLQRVAESKQVIVSTQSVELLNSFQPEDVVVVQRERDATVLKRLDARELTDWLADDYSLGELWKRNIIGGRPA